jgi:hypothetical protein
MARPYIRVLLGIAAVLLIAESPAAAQSITGHGSAARSQPLRAAIMRAARQLAADPKGQHAQSPDTAGQPGPSWAGRHPVLTGALIGTTGGLVWAAVICRTAECEADPRSHVGVFGGTGAGAGAATGVVVPAVRR